MSYDWFPAEWTEKFLVVRKGVQTMELKEDIRFFAGEPSAHILTANDFHDKCDKCKNILQQNVQINERIKNAVYCPVCGKVFCLDCVKIEKVENGSNWICPNKHLLREWRLLSPKPRWDNR